jgi:hypothetical protein
MADEENEVEMSLVMPFLPVTSRGGPFDDQAFVAGYEMGRLDEVLRAAPPTHSTTIRTDNAAQADLIAMQHGYRCTAEPSEEWPEWTLVSFTPMTPMETPDA